MSCPSRPCEDVLPGAIEGFMADAVKAVLLMGNRWLLLSASWVASVGHSIINHKKVVTPKRCKLAHDNPLTVLNSQGL